MFARWYSRSNWHGVVAKTTLIAIQPTLPSGNNRPGSSYLARRDARALHVEDEGLLLGTVTLPPIDVLEIGEDYVLGVFRDEMEVEYLRVHAIHKQESAPHDL
jgi:hypothetical protein